MTGMLLADHGADVTRIERPDGDPFGNLLGYKVWHRGKKNAVIDLKDDADGALFLKLAADADVVMDGHDKLVTTLFINAHIHTPEALFRGRYENLPLEMWMTLA